MSVQTDDATVDLVEPVPEEPKGWNPATRILFRFVFVYFGLFCVLFPQILISFLGPFFAKLPEDLVMRYAELPSPIVEWVGRHVFDVEAVVRYDSGSGDQTYFFVMVFCLLVVAAVSTLIWTVLDRRRREYRRLAGWFLLFIRLCLASQMLLYGFAKAIPTQMPEPSLVALLQPYGDFTLMSVLWSQVGTSPVYQILLGCAEVLGGVLLLLPRTTLAGVLLSLVSMAQVFVLNMTYDVPVKLLSFHLLVLCLVLLAPDARRLTSVLLGGAAGPSTSPQPFHGRAARIAAVVQIVLAIWMSAGFAQTGIEGYREWGPDRPRSELYGIWTVDEFTRAGQPVPPLVTDETRWRRVIFDDVRAVYVQGMNDSFTGLPGAVDGDAHTVVLHQDPAAPPWASFTFERPAFDRLLLTGTLDGQPVTMSLTRMDENQFTLRRNGFHLVQDYPNLGAGTS
ncbi:DoxX family protein [Nocardia huaxiensis]|uniref:DoxX family protein n=1 Tax=Nocardia huaxiensis TaxID=2755382 RepID=UPI001E4E8837|nr:DoxX family protein [Nocardia huaxiensis]UFS96642.1 DoxX family protein [Nocardia huaxiensis]